MVGYTVCRLTIKYFKIASVCLWSCLIACLCTLHANVSTVLYNNVNGVMVLK